MRTALRSVALRWAPAVALALSCGTAHAHHSVQNFDFRRTITIEGTVLQVQWKNPHAYVYVRALAQSGASDWWLVEVGVPNGLVRNGWRKDTIKVGDKVHMRMTPDRNGRLQGALKEVTLPDGSKMKGFANGLGE